MPKLQAHCSHLSTTSEVPLPSKVTTDHDNGSCISTTIEERILNVFTAKNKPLKNFTELNIAQYVYILKYHTVSKTTICICQLKKNIGRKHFEVLQLSYIKFHPLVLAYNYRGHLQQWSDGNFIFLLLLHLSFSHLFDHVLI